MLCSIISGRATPISDASFGWRFVAGTRRTRSAGSWCAALFSTRRATVPPRRLDRRHHRAQESSGGGRSSRGALSEERWPCWSLLAEVAHELNNPLSVVIGQVVLLQEMTRIRPDRPAPSASGCRGRSRAKSCVLPGDGAPRQAERFPVALNGIVETAVELLSFQLRTAEIRIELALDGELQDRRRPRPDPSGADQSSTTRGRL